MPNEPAAHPPADNVPPAEQPGHFPWKIVLAILIIGGIVAFALFRRQHGATPQTKGPPGRRPGQTGANFPVAAVLGTVQTKDVPIFLDGLGTVQAFNTITVRSRVDGNLIKVLSQEGQDVHASDILAQIDPDPFKTVVAQAEAKKAQDEAQLANAQIDLKRNETLLANKIVAQEVYDTAKALVRQYTATVQADQASID